MSGAVTWETVFGFLTLASVGGGVWWRVHTRINAVEREHDAFKLEVAKNYATQHSIQQVEERVVQAIERLGDRLDRFLEVPRSRNRT